MSRRAIALLACLAAAQVWHGQLDRDGNVFQGSPWLAAGAFFLTLASGTHYYALPAMSGVLARLNMPSRGDVLTLSQRMTHIEMVLDDVGAGFDQLRRSIPTTRPQRTPSRDRDIGTGPPDAFSAKEA